MAKKEFLPETKVHETINTMIKTLKKEGLDTKSISDGFHTFNDLYNHRRILTQIIAHDHKEHAWKSKQHHDGTMFDGDFIVGFTTSEGQYSYHYKLEFWNDFNVPELEKAPEYDGHQPNDIDRLLSLLK